MADDAQPIGEVMRAILTTAAARGWSFHLDPIIDTAAAQDDGDNLSQQFMAAMLRGGPQPPQGEVHGYRAYLIARNRELLFVAAGTDPEVAVRALYASYETAGLADPDFVGGF